MNRSIIWVLTENERSGDRSRLPRLRAAQFLPVPVESVDVTLHLLRQFQAGAVVVRTTTTAWNECMRLVATGAPIVVLVDTANTIPMDRYLAAGCAAVIAEPCPFKSLQAVLQRVASGERQVRWPDTSVARVG